MPVGFTGLSKDPTAKRSGSNVLRAGLTTLSSSNTWAWAARDEGFYSPPLHPRLLFHNQAVGPDTVVSYCISYDVVGERERERDLFMM